jgi:hypothetical protein
VPHSQSAGTPGQIGQKSSGSARQRCASCPHQGGLRRVEGLAGGSRHVGPLVRRSMAVGALGWRPWSAPLNNSGHERCSRRRTHYPALHEDLALTTVIRAAP